MPEEKGKLFRYLLLLFSSHLGLWIPPLRFPAALCLLGFLPGYVLVDRLSLWKTPLFAAVGSLGFSLLITPLAAVSGCLLFQRVDDILILGSLDTVLLGLLFFLRVGNGNKYIPEEQRSFQGPLLFLISSGIWMYLDQRGLGPYCDDWNYLVGIVKELSRNMPPLDPEAADRTLKYPWVFYFFCAALHRLGGVSVWKTLEAVSAWASFVYLGLVMMILGQTVRKKGAGVWAVALLVLGRETQWVFDGIRGLGWHPTIAYENWLDLQVNSVFAFLWGGWYLLPSSIPFLFSLYFLISYDQQKKMRDLGFSLGTCAVGCLFHPAHFLFFMLGCSLWMAIRWRQKRFSPALLGFFLTPLPYLLTFYLLLRPQAPSAPLYQLHGDLTSFRNTLAYFLGHHGVIIPFALWGLGRSREVLEEVFPFGVVYLLLALIGSGQINHLSYILFPSVFYLSLFGAVGLSSLTTQNRRVGFFVSLLVLAVIAPPFFAQVAYRWKISWAGMFDEEQKIAGRFIRQETEENSRFVIFPESRYATTCVEGLGERKVVFGWMFHLNRYEKEEYLISRAQEVIDFYRDPERTSQEHFLRKYQVDYIFLGPDEGNYMRKHHRDPEDFSRNYRKVFQAGEIEILKVRPKEPYGGFHRSGVYGIPNGGHSSGKDGLPHSPGPEPIPKRP